MEIVSGRTGKPHVTSQQFRQIIEGIVGSDSCILPSGENLEPELASNNILKIRSGMMSHHGNVSSVKIGTYDEVELTNGSQGMKRIDLVVNRYTKNAETGVEANDWIVIVGTPDAESPVAPAYTVGNLQEGDLIDDCPVLEIHYDGLNITEVKKLLEIAQSNKDLTDAVAELNGNMNGIKYKRYTVTKNFVKGTNDAITIDIPWSKIVSIQGTLRYGANLHALPTSPVGGSGTYNEGMLAQLVITSSNVVQLWVTTAWISTTLTVVVGYAD